jgi:hypothetical protein
MTEKIRRFGHSRGGLVYMYSLSSRFYYNKHSHTCNFCVEGWWRKDGRGGRTHVAFSCVTLHVELPWYTVGHVEGTTGGANRGACLLVACSSLYFRNPRKTSIYSHRWWFTSPSSSITTKRCGRFLLLPVLRSSPTTLVGRLVWTLCTGTPLTLITGNLTPAFWSSPDIPRYSRYRILV